MMPVENSKKRKASPVQVNTPGIPAKRVRIESPPPPVVLDEFETEAKREVDASAGLTGSQITAGQKLSLSHQVCNNTLTSLSQLSTLLGPASGRGSQKLRLYSHIIPRSSISSCSIISFHS
jgi:hypothetical protein